MTGENRGVAVAVGIVGGDCVNGGNGVNGNFSVTSACTCLKNLKERQIDCFRVLDWTLRTLVA